MKAQYYSAEHYRPISYSQIDNTLSYIDQFANLSLITINVNQLPTDVDSSELEISTFTDNINNIIVHCASIGIIGTDFDYVMNDVKSYLTHLLTYGKKDHSIEYTVQLLTEAELYCEEQIARYDLNRKIRFKANLVIKLTDGKTETYPSRQLFLALLNEDERNLITEAMEIRKELWQEILLQVRKEINSVKINFNQLSALESAKEIPYPLLVEIIQVFWESEYIMAIADLEKFEKHIIILLGANKDKYSRSKSEYKSRKKDKMKALRELVEHLTQKLTSPKKRPEN